ncbi:hypothetical protein [Actinomadura terrae]|uniref:hypothetical protein n=1 Tax=Actinomadura terrae TaxID=604353 RepID=UPI001FA7FEC5|nr:hypothetical protein [Actinomadura terrae]
MLRTECGWTLLDYEGEPARTPGERRALARPPTTKAGALPPESGRRLETRAHAWAARNRLARLPVPLRSPGHLTT